ncbi:hypothetical protein GCM10009827_096480 [Dactylosporangium maewongense]|uniref:Uncharacterized protein n=1 Tax=Dactylosporangium maewongense TaxID=634393 RepID=A0ABN2CNP4_9ACTN
MCPGLNRRAGAPSRWSGQDRRALTQDTVAEGLLLFGAEGLVAGDWKPPGGASIKTCFIGSCVLSFADQYRAGRRHKAR